MLKAIDIYTDGACSGNPGPGGYGAILLYKTSRKELSGGYRWTTNNRMELRALIVAIEALKEPCQTTIYTDSRYLIDAMTKGWIQGWRRRGWLTSKRTEVQNRDLWEHLDTILAAHETTFIWVKGHADNEHNNRCDELAVAACHNPANPPDAPYEVTNPPPTATAKPMAPTAAPPPESPA